MSLGTEVQQCLWLWQLMSILKAGGWARFSTAAGHYFQHTTIIDKHQVSVQHVVQGLSSQLEALTYIKSCRYFGLSGPSSSQF